MRLFISVFLISFAGWTVSAHIGVLFGLNLKALLILTPFVVVSLFGGYFYFVKTKSLFSSGRSAQRSLILLGDKYIYIFSLVALVVLPLALRLSWIAFWILSILILMISIFRSDEVEMSLADAAGGGASYFNFSIVSLITITAIGMAFIVSRSDLDDSFYVAIASFSSSNPTHAILSTDPMLGESSFPLIFPSYRFASFELFSGVIAYLMSVPAMDVYYIYLLPIWVIATVAATFLLTQQISPKHWLLTGAVAFLLTVVLGEMHRSPANFSFVRIFQGKAVFLSVIVPTIFYLTARFFSERGTRADLFLLGCCQVVSVGLTNFGILMGPIVGFGALMSNLPLVLKGDLKKLYYAFAVLLIPFPFLINVALESKGSPVINFGTENPANVWASVFGSHQQYLVGFLILAGPVLAKDIVTRWRLAVPSLLLFAIYLNPWFANFIAKYVTTPPVYWRVFWSFPVLVFAAVSFCMIMAEFFERKSSRLIPVILSFVVAVLTICSLPFNTLRSENIGSIEGFASWKVPVAHLDVAQKAMDRDNDGGRVLAPDEIAGVISRFEKHPRLISTRGLYLDLMRPLVGESEFMPRKLLYDFVTSNGNQQTEGIRSALRMLDVSVIVLRSGIETSFVFTLLESEGFKRVELVNGYSIWARRLL